MTQPTSKDPPPGISVDDAIRRTGRARATIYRAIKDNTLRSHLIAGRRIIPLAELDEWNRAFVEAKRWLGTRQNAG